MSLWSMNVSKTNRTKHRPFKTTHSKGNHKWDLCISWTAMRLNRGEKMEMGEVSSLWWEKDFSDLRKSLHSLSKNKNLLKMYSLFGHLRCRWVCFFIGTDMEKFIITLLPHQWIICSEWVPSEWESKHHNNPQVGLIHYKLTSCKAKRWVFVVNKSIIKMLLTSNCCFQLKYESTIHNIALSSEKVISSESCGWIWTWEHNKGWTFFTGGRSCPSSIIMDYGLVFWP